jgi:hypothetical protein
VKALTGIYHHRIAYPGYDFNRMGVNALPETGAVANDKVERLDRFSAARSGRSRGD